MGFKKTAEGRVFFQGTDEGGHEPPQGPVRSNGYAPPPASALASPNMQNQIVGLLKTLNERLKATQADREKMAREIENYRVMIDELQQKTLRSERAYQDLNRRVTAGGPGTGKAEGLAHEALKELQETRKIVMTLEDKASRNDQGLASLRNEILETRKINNQIIGKQTSLEKFSLEQAEKLSESASTFGLLASRIKETEQKHNDLSAKITEASSEQSKLMRKLDKAIEDRARFMRKIDRIEEALIQTRDSLNAKAMVLLTDQNAAGVSGYAYDAPAEDLRAQLAALQTDAESIGTSDHRPENALFNAMPWWRKQLHMQATGVSVLVVGALLGGWAISEMQQPSLSDFGLTEYSQPMQQSAESAKATQNETADRTQTETQPLDMALMDWAIPEEQVEAAGIPAEAETVEQAAAARPINQEQNDIGALDLNNQDDVEKLLNADSQAAGEVLNQIEPSNLVPQAASAQIAAVAVQDAPVQKPAPVDASALSDPASLTKPDTGLPDVVKQIEDQAFQGVPEAQHDLAAIYTAGHGGVKQDYKRAAFWFEQAAQRGIANAAYNLGVLYHQGLGVKADLNKALDWYKKAAAMGHPEAQYNLGIAYIEGIGVGYDPQKAATYFKNAADQDIMEAAYNLGLIYENGLLGEAQPDQALVWYKMAADKGSPEAREALELLAKNLNIKLEDVNRLAESMKSYKKTEAVTPAQPDPVKKKTLAHEAEIPSALVITSQIQDYLAQMGLYPGPSDGVLGPQTADAIRTYQKMHNLHPDGQPTRELLMQMLADAGQLEQGSSAF